MIGRLTRSQGRGHGTVHCADCDWSVAAVEAVAWHELAAHRAKTHDAGEV